MGLNLEKIEITAYGLMKELPAEKLKEKKKDDVDFFKSEQEKLVLQLNELKSCLRAQWNVSSQYLR